MNDLKAFAAAFLGIFDSHRFQQADLSIASLSVEEAYAVQQLVIDQRIQRGERTVGYKVGCTSTAIREQFGLSEPICGRILEPHVFHGDSDLKISDYYQPAIEPEFVLTMGQDLYELPAADEQLIEAIDFVAPGIEVHNYRFWFGEPTRQELIASNGIHAGLVIGEQKIKPQEIDWTLQSVEILCDGSLVAAGVAADIMGGPLTSLRWLAGHLIQRGGGLKAGEIVIPGSAVELVPVNRGDRICARFPPIGSVNAVFG